MTKYRVHTTTGYVEFPSTPTQEQYNSVNGVGEIEEITYTIESGFDIEQYKKEIETSVQQHLDNIAKSLWYDNIQEASKYVNQELRLDWKQESLYLIEYDTQIWTIVEEYFSTLTEETIINNFIETLPTFNG